MTLDAFLARLEDVRPEGDQHRALCPGHPDRRPSLIVGERAGKILVHCRSRQCRPEAILRPLGLSLKDLFIDARPQSRVIAQKSENALTAARREILATARRQAWARAGVLERYQNADLERAVMHFAFATIRQLQERAPAAPNDAWRLVAVAADLEREARTLDLALGEVAA